MEQAKTVAVVDNTTLKTANDIKLEINAQTKTVKELRLEFTRPLDEFKKTILDAEKDILLNLEEAKSIVATEILKYEEKLEADRRAEEQRVQGICSTLEANSQAFTTVEQVERAIASVKATYVVLPEADRENPAIKLSYARSCNDLEARAETIMAEQKAEAERQRLAEEAKHQSEEMAKIAAEQAKVAADRQKLEDERRQLEREKEARALEAAKLEAEKAAAKAEEAKPKSNIVTNYDIEIVDANQVPAQYLIPDEQKIRAAVKQGIREIPGVAITERKVVR